MTIGNRSKIGRIRRDAMENIQVVFLIALMVVVGIFVKVTSFQIDLANQRIDDQEVQIAKLERRVHSYGTA